MIEVETAEVTGVSNSWIIFSSILFSSCGVGSGWDAGSAEVPSISNIAIGSPTLAIPSFCTKIFKILPETGVGTSESTLSVAISTTLSSSATKSPSLKSHSITVASITPSPMEGNNNLYSAIIFYYERQR